MKSLKIIAALLFVFSTAANARGFDRSLECERGEEPLKLYEKFSGFFDDDYDFRVTTAPAGQAYHDEDEVLGCILTRKPRRVASKKVYECLAFDGRNYMLSTNRNCEGQDRVGTVGYVLSQPENGAIALYRCFDGFSHSAWTSELGGSVCEGLGSAEGIMGYIYEGFHRHGRR